jgi:DNA-binding response OmpR family regulator
MKNIRGNNVTSGHAEPSAAQRPLRVMVADDDRDTVITLTMLLREEGHEVRSVSSGRQALAAIADFDPDAVLLDIALPDLSGWDVARAIRKQRENDSDRRPLLIGISGEYKQGADRVLSEIVGFDHYFLKPYDPKVLLELLAPLQLPPAEP